MVSPSDHNIIHDEINVYFERGMSSGGEVSSGKTKGLPSLFFQEFRKNDTDFIPANKAATVTFFRGAKSLNVKYRIHLVNITVGFYID